MIEVSMLAKGLPVVHAALWKVLMDTILLLN
jgi:hypothetical protein